MRRSGGTAADSADGPELQEKNKSGSAHDFKTSFESRESSA